MARNQKANISNESTGTKVKKEKIVRKKKDENRGIKKAMKVKIGRKAGTKKEIKKRDVEVNTIKRKVTMVNRKA